MRVVHGRESGVVVGFGPKGVIEVMLSDGFKIPFAKSDLVVVSALEDKVFALDPTLDAPKSTPFKAQSFSDKGIFPFADQGSHLIIERLEWVSLPGWHPADDRFVRSDMECMDQLLAGIPGIQDKRMNMDVEVIADIIQNIHDGA